MDDRAMPDGVCFLCDYGEGDHLCPEPYPQTPAEDAAATLDADRRYGPTYRPHQEGLD